MHLVYSLVKVRDHGRADTGPASGWLYDLRAFELARVTLILGLEAGRTRCERRAQAPSRRSSVPVQTAWQAAKAIEWE